MTTELQQTTDQETATESDPTSSKKRLAATLGGGALALALILAACGDSSEGTEGTGNEASEGVEGADGGTEGSDGSEGGSGGEGGEGNHSEGGGNGEASEGGVVNLLAADQTYDETINGARLILAYDSAGNAFTGTVENTTTGPLTRARVEVHLSNGAELGPTTPTDLAPGETINLTLPSTPETFDTWSAHPEVGNAEGSEGNSEGPEGTEGGSANEGPEGTEGGGQAAAGSTTHLTSTGISRGAHTTQALAADESYAGKLNDLELAITYDSANDRFVGRVKNEANEGLCNTNLNVVLDGRQDAPQSVLIPALDLRGRADFTIDAGNTAFVSWETEADTFTCTTVISDGGEGGSEGTGNEGGSEGSGEGAGHESGTEGGGEGGAESGEETAPSTPIDQVAKGNFNNLDYNVAYDKTSKAFRGTVTNNTNQTVCGSRLEIHMATNGNVIELGPTIDTDLAPGETLDVVLSADPITPQTYSLHPESSPCP